MNASAMQTANLEADTTDAMAPVVVDFSEVSHPQSPNAKEIAEGATKALMRERKKGGINDIAEGRADVYRLNPYLLRTDPEFNCRDLADADNITHIDDLARSIAVKGVEMPLTVWWENNAPIVSDGHIRLLAVFRAIEVYGAKETVRTVPVMTERRKMTPVERLMTPVVRGNSKPLSIWERSAQLLKAINAGGTTKEVAHLAGISEMRVLQLIELYRTATPEIRQLVDSKKVSATFAWKTLKDNDNNAEEALAVLRGAVDVASKAGRDTALPKHARAFIETEAKGGEVAETNGTDATASDDAEGAETARKVRFSRPALVTALRNAVVKQRDDKVTITMSQDEYNRIKLMLDL